MCESTKWYTFLNNIFNNKYLQFFLSINRRSVSARFTGQHTQQCAVSVLYPPNEQFLRKQWPRGAKIMQKASFSLVILLHCLVEFDFTFTRYSPLVLSLPCTVSRDRALVLQRFPVLARFAENCTRFTLSFSQTGNYNVIHWK